MNDHPRVGLSSTDNGGQLTLVLALDVPRSTITEHRASEDKESDMFQVLPQV